MAAITLLMPFIMKKNEAGINSLKPLAAFIQTKTAGKPVAPIMVYDQLLPSLSFYTNKKIITLYNNNSKARREIQFEDSLQKETKNYIDLSLIKDSSSFFRAPAGFVIAKLNHDLPDSLFYLRAHLKNRTVMDKWIVYY
jgi:4-amino-4-deoxy-L-arabinose transferase